MNSLVKFVSSSYCTKTGVFVIKTLLQTNKTFLPLVVGVSVMMYSVVVNSGKAKVTVQ